ncbi:MAG: hypothetical protein ACYDD9_14205 [Acidithiobacillus sp.]
MATVLPRAKTQGQRAILDWARIEVLRGSGPVPEHLLLSPDRVIARSQGFTVVYGPFDAKPSRVARLMLVGLTPGYRQLKLANEALRDATTAGIADPDIVTRMKREKAAFAGSMRTNLIAMLDELGLPEYLGLGSTAELFSSRADLVFTTSSLRYPVFYGEDLRNFSGCSRMMERPLFQEMVDLLLRADVTAMPDTLLVPLGIAAESALVWLAKKNELNPRRILSGFPHPSGANGHRKRVFLKNVTILRAQLGTWFAGASR